MIKKATLIGLRLYLAPWVTGIELALEPVVRYKKFRRK